jgi:hypothetical protein
MNLQALMDKHKIRHADLAFITGRTTRAVHQWVYGIRPIPRSTELLLIALDEGKIDETWLAGQLSKHLARAR